LGDERCGVDLEDPAFKGTGAVIDLLRDRAFTASGLSGFEAGWFTFGTVEWTSGANAGRRTEVLGHDVTDGIAVLTLLEAPVREIAEDDGFTIRAGCDKRMETCGAKFANTAQLSRLPAHPRPGRRSPLRHEGRRPRRVRAVTSADPTRVIAIARSWLGTPYHDQASLRGVGCDCLGLARGVWREVVGPEPFPIPPYSRDWGETRPARGAGRGRARMMIEVPSAKAGPGALVLFRMMPRAIAKHVGILTGPDTFLHAYERLGVIEEPLTQSWRRRIAFAFLFPQR
jgi:NlpC/P60 family putative phage cell wall peptidase